MSLIPVNNDVLVWAREFRALSQLEAAERLNISVEDLKAMEKGEKLPSLSTFEDMATKYRLPQATLFMQSPPSVPGLPDDYRTIEGVAPKHSFEFSVAFSAVNGFRRVLDILSSEDEEFNRADYETYNMGMDPELIATKERERLGLIPENPLNWSSGTAFNKWRSIIEAYGIPVFFQKFPLDDCRGFTLTRNHSTPVIVINKSEPFVVARTFTLLHEYCHLLINRAGLSDLDDRNEVEAFCNKFAAAILMPKETLRLLMKSWPNAPVDWDDSRIKYWAGRLKVSRVALAIRLEDLGLAPAGFSKKYTWHSGYTPAKKSDGGNPVAAKLSELGGSYTSAIFNAYKRGVISQPNAEEFLSIDNKHFDKVAAYLEKREELAVVG